MANRADLQDFLEQLMGNENVYFDPPESMRIKYPGIRYSLTQLSFLRANNKVYKTTPGYEIILIDSNPDSEYPDKLMNVKYCRFVRHYPSDGLHHWVFNLYHE